MKKFLVLFLALSVLGGAAFAQDLGLTAGVEFGMMELNGDGDTIDSGYVRPSIAYENNELVDNLDLFLEIGVPFWIKPEFWLGIDLNLDLGYNLAIGDAGKLRIGVQALAWIPGVEDFGFSPELEPHKGPAGPVVPSLGGLGDLLDILAGLGGLGLDDDDFDIDVPAAGGGGAMSGPDFQMWVIPGVRYTQDLGSMAVFGEVNLPLWLITPDGMDALEVIGLNLILGASMDNGFGGEIEITNFISNAADEAKFFQYVTLTPYYEAGPLYAELEVGIPTFEDGMKSAGLFLQPEVRYMVMDNLQVYAGLPISGIASDNDMILGLYLGAKFKF